MYCARCGTWTPDDGSPCARCGEPAPVAAPPVAEAAPATPGTAAVPEAADPRPVATYAGFWRRFAAGFVDGMVLLFPDALLRMACGVPIRMTFRSMDEREMSSFLIATLLSAVLSWIYCAGLECSRWQGTLGQQLLDLRVTDTHLRRLSFLRSSGRHFAKLLSLALCGVGYLFNLWTTRRQTLHDAVAGCLVVRPAAPAGAVRAPHSGAGS